MTEPLSRWRWIAANLFCLIQLLPCVSAQSQPIVDDSPSADIARPSSLTAVCHRVIPVPKRFCINYDGRSFGGDLRIGDLNGDGRCDFLVYRCDDSAPSGAHMGGMKPSFLGAFEMDGTVLWSAGKGGYQPARPMSVAIAEMTGDQAADVICFWHQPSSSVETGWHSLADVVVQIRDGRTGKVIQQAAPPEIVSRRMQDPQGANWVHQRILIANFRGTKAPRDLLIKLGETYVALNENLEILWTYATRHIQYSHCPAYIPAVGDLDGDGRDEVNGGYFVLDDDGTPRWEKKLGRHMDSVLIAPWDDGRMRAICSGFGHVVSHNGDTILSLGEQQVPHGQEVRVADFRDDLPGPEMVLRSQGHTPDLLIVSSETSTVVRQLKLNDSPNNVGMEPVYWNGPEQPALLYNGGVLWDLKTNNSLALPELPAANGKQVHRMGFYHAIPANLFGGDGEELVLWDPTAATIFVYGSRTDAPNSTPRANYVPGPRQYNPRILN